METGSVSPALIGIQTNLTGEEDGGEGEEERYAVFVSFRGLDMFTGIREP